MLKKFIGSIKNCYDPVYTAIHPEVFAKHCVVTFISDVMEYIFLFVVIGFGLYLLMAFAPWIMNLLG